MRRRSSSWVLTIVLWLTYLSADYIAIYVLGHLAVRSSEPGHQLMSFWTPFLLVHLGGQDTITALSKQDNELWMRHLLSLVSQVAVALYVVVKASWPDGCLKATMVLIFLSGCIKYVERSYCLYCASPTKLRSDTQGSFSDKLKVLQDIDDTDRSCCGFGTTRNERRADRMRITLEKVVNEGWSRHGLDEEMFRDILSVDAPLNVAETVSFAETELPGMLKRFSSKADRFNIYEHVGAVLVNFYLDLYTKNPLTSSVCSRVRRSSGCSKGPDDGSISLSLGSVLLSSCTSFFCCAFCCIFISLSLGPVLLYMLFRYVATPIALVLFWAAEKGDQDQLHSGGRSTDIFVSYILLVGAIVLDMSSAIIFIISDRIQLPRAWSKKQWSEELAQYSMIRRHVVQDTSCMASIQQWIGRCLGAWGVELLDLTHTPITQDFKEFILDILLGFGIRKKWNIASSRGRTTLEECSLLGLIKTKIKLHDKPLLVMTTTSDGFDYPTSVLIWHIATDMCYYYSGDDAAAAASTSTSDQQLNKHKNISRELSNYVTYLVFKCGVTLTTNYQHVHDKAHLEINSDLDGLQDSEKDAVDKLFNEQGQHEPDYSEVDIFQVPAADDNKIDACNHIKRLQKSAEALDSDVLPRACSVAQELIEIKDKTDRWSLIASVWSEMLFYAAPRCGADFHYKHLSGGGEFVTHVLLLMKFLGPFLPPPIA
uniref:DUF4220 domain-containing protein n=1 Tax=Leersia perrieri TaxID=77586 RepID=A0A0D9XJ76_9ORYZ